MHPSLPDPGPPRWPPETCEEVRLWLNARSDGECSPAQEGWLARHLDGCPGCSREWAALERTRLALETARLREPADFEREALARALAPRLLESTGWGLAAAGLLTLGAFGLVRLWREDETPLAVRLGATALLLGLSLLFLRVLWERLRVRRVDPYQSVER